MDAHDIRQHLEDRLVLAREQLGRADRLQRSLARQAAILLGAAGLLIAVALAASLAARGPGRIGAALCLGAAALGDLGAAVAAAYGLLRGLGRGRTAGPPGAPPAGLFFDLAGTAGVFTAPAEYASAFRSATVEEMTGRLLAALWRAGRAARAQAAAVRWSAGLLTAGIALSAVALVLALAGA